MRKVKLRKTPTLSVPTFTKPELYDSTCQPSTTSFSVFVFDRFGGMPTCGRSQWCVVEANRLDYEGEGSLTGD